MGAEGRGKRGGERGRDGHGAAPLRQEIPLILPTFHLLSHNTIHNTPLLSQVLRVNGTDVLNLAHLKQLVDSAQGDYVSHSKGSM